MQSEAGLMLLWFVGIPWGLLLIWAIYSVNRQIRRGGGKKGSVFL
jgi:hypothetical protein